MRQLGPITDGMASSLIQENRATPTDAEVLRKIANKELREDECYAHLLRLMIQCADLRRRLEGPKS